MGMRIPHERLSEDVLIGVIESFVLREGTDYGAHEVSLATKVEQVRRQLECGEIHLLFDAEAESITLVPRAELPRGV